MLFLFRLAPRWLIYTSSWVIGYLAYFLKNNQRHISEVNLKIAYPQWSESQRQRLIRRVMVETVKTLLESLKLWQMDGPYLRRLIRQTTGLALLETALREQRAVILLVPHLGNWEMVNLFLSQFYEITGLYRTQKSAWLDELMFKSRGKFGAHALPADTNSVRGLMKAIKQNHIIFILPDQNPGKGSGVFADFYHFPALTPVLPVRLASRTSAKVLFAYAERLPYAAGFCLHIEEAGSNLSQENTELACGAMNKDLERLINGLPQQYWWGYSRYRHRPEGEPPLYQKD